MFKTRWYYQEIQSTAKVWKWYKKNVKTEIYVHVEDMCLYGLLEVVKKKYEEEQGDYR